MDTRHGDGRRTILIVDDDEVAAAGFAAQIQRAGFRALLAGDGARALTLLATNDVDAILLDLLMPGMNGWELLGVRRGDARLRRVPVVVTSAVDGGIDPAELLPWDAVLLRPFDSVSLAATLRRCFAHAEGGGPH